jgi:hypothetical protein
MPDKSIRVKFVVFELDTNAENVAMVSGDLKHGPAANLP